jgi:hypothetical protein
MSEDIYLEPSPDTPARRKNAQDNHHPWAHLCGVSTTNVKMDEGVDFIWKLCYTMISWGRCHTAYLYG